MQFVAGQTLAHFEILGTLGSGAMGEVYRARDTRLKREVAIKVLPADLAADEERLRRFEREARTLASLSHANLAHVYGIDQVGDTCYMVMELVRGENLATRLARGALPLAEALDVCRQVAEGLEVAHEAGVVHRDLKPANIMLLPDGGVKLLDFGLARPAAERRSKDDSALLTEEGRVLGTPTYMAPEQVRGNPLDRRADIWAFGCVLYECLSGQRPFTGATVSDVLAAVLEHEPDASALPSGTPARLRETIERCLRKDPRQRLRDVGEARITLGELARAPADDASRVLAAPGRRRLAAPLAVATAVGMAAGLVLRQAWDSGEPASDDPARAALVSVPLTTSQYVDGSPTWSPEGEWIAFGRMTSGSSDLWLKNVSSGDERLRRGGPGDEDVPRWSPDGAYIAYVTTGRPGTPVMLLPPHAEGATGEREFIDTNVRVFDAISFAGTMGSRPWANDGSSLLVSRVTDDGTMAVFRVGRDDGRVEQLTFPPVGANDLSASLSFDERRIAFVRITLGRGPMLVMAADGGEPEVLLDELSNDAAPAWTPDGRSVLFKTPGSGLWEIDVATRSPRQVVAVPGGLEVGAPTIRSSGEVAYCTTWHDTSLTELDRETGNSSWLNRHARDNYAPRYSPDGSEVAYHSTRTGDPEIWVREPDGNERRITRDPGEDFGPEWSPRGDRLIFASNRDGPFRLYTADHDGNDCRLLWSQALSPTYDAAPIRWSPAGSSTGELIGCIVSNAEGNMLWGVPPDDPGAARRLLDGVVGFDWYLDSQRVLCTLDVGLAEELVAVHLGTGERRTLWNGPHGEIDVSPDGSSVIFSSGRGHFGMGLAILALVPPEGPDELPSADGEPVDIVRPEGVWHVHNGSWAPDGKRVAYVHDADRSTIYALVGLR